MEVNKKIILEWSQGNFGALNFFLDLIKPYNRDSGEYILSRLEECPSIRGTNLYVMYSDLCDRDMGQVKKLLEKCPNDILEEACSRQDYSGQELVKEYLE
jgi:hypothetical protein